LISEPIELGREHDWTPTDILSHRMVHVAVSQMEKRPDSLLSSLSQYKEALGDKLELHAKFPDGQDIEIKQFNRA